MRAALVFAALTILQAPHALAQNGRPACDGDYTVVRFSAIKPGKMQAFMQAVADHKNWYRSHGFKDNVIVASRVFDPDDKTGTKYSEIEVVTLHVRPPAAEGKHDAAWDAYVKEYRDSSDIRSEYRTCMPKLVP
jgi:hypothetical protein